MEWQPARFVQVHNDEFVDRENENIAKTRTIHLRPALRSELDFSTNPSECDAERFFWVKEMPGCYVCEHEIVTD